MNKVTFPCYTITFKNYTIVIMTIYNNITAKSYDCLN